MATSDQVPPLHRRISSPLFLSLMGSCLLTLAALGCLCGKNESRSNETGQASGPYKITPPEATVFVQQTFQFTGSSPLNNIPIWSVIPISGGTIDASGLFTASSTPGRYAILAMWNNDQRCTAAATVTVLHEPPIAHLDPGLVQAFGCIRQSTAEGSIRHAAMVGEWIPAQKAQVGAGGPQVRHGFYPPPVQ